MQHEHELITGTALRMKDSFVGRYLKDWWTLNIEKTWNGLREDECHLHQKQIFTARLALTKKVLRSNLYQTIKTSKRLAQMWKWNRTLLVRNSMGNSFDSDDDDEINSACCDPPGHPSVFDIDEDFVPLSLLDQTKK
ncbi:uncharacterized protein LOC133205550 isoform X1 [Saccostrea echinata]|uniref:uncharacterized protein LOC133205550 isoform X1 n=1 Tax=Saccostrea echinata TaxID=191078 RepID=UPI002A825205|nr:uncharacterized protein LOC133205550 isoform X1 [Saccostrea echinata]XP_061197371.1 uncharacterized protein LOC133205550 isoform X1 [Saccostrea echinata]